MVAAGLVMSRFTSRPSSRVCSSHNDGCDRASVTSSSWACCRARRQGLLGEQHGWLRRRNVGARAMVAAGLGMSRFTSRPSSRVCSMDNVWDSMLSLDGSLSSRLLYLACCGGLGDRSFRPMQAASCSCMQLQAGGPGHVRHYQPPLQQGLLPAARHISGHKADCRQTYYRL